MSADNGVYILKTLGKKPGEFEYRVQEMQAVENYEWDPKRKRPVNDPDVHIKNARKMWGCPRPRPSTSTDDPSIFEPPKVFTSENEALKEAYFLYQEIMASDFPILEYGISTIEIPRKFTKTPKKRRNK